jgi:hypothetical protein
MKRQIRIREIPDRFDGKKWHTRPQALVRLGDVGKWSMVRPVEYPGACPTVISRKDWDKMSVCLDPTKIAGFTTLEESALATGSRRAKTAQPVECEASQSGGDSRNARKEPQGD